MLTVITEKPVDVCVLGLGVAGGIVAGELAVNGVKVAGIEKGPYWDYATDYTMTKYDEWGVGMIHKWDNPFSLNTYTWRNNSDQFAIVRRRHEPGTAPLGHGVGGGAQHYAAAYGRYAPWSYTPLSLTLSKYGPSFLSGIEPNLDLIDFPVTYDQMVPYYQEFEKAFGVTGTNQNPFIPMSSNFPLPPHPDTAVGTMFQTATEAMGYHPFPNVTGLASQAYVNQYGVQINACVYEGWCGAFCAYQCETGAKANSACRTIPAAIKSGNFTMALNSYIFRLDSNSNGQITAARYYDAEGNIHVQPAKAFFVGLWGMFNARLPLLSGVGGTPYNHTTVSGTVGRGSCPQGGGASASVAGVLNVGNNAYPAGNASGGGYNILDWADDNFDHTGLNFIGGAEVSAGTYAYGIPGYGSGPYNAYNIATGFSAANIGSAYKASVKDYYLPTKTVVGFSASLDALPQTTHYHDLDPHYTDIYGDPLARVTTDGPDANSYNLNAYITPRLAPILTKMGASNVTNYPGPASVAVAGHCLGEEGSYHHKGGTRMGLNSSTSMLNLYQQSWTASNLFITGETAMPFDDSITAGTHAIGPQCYLAAEGIKKYLASPGELANSI